VKQYPTVPRNVFQLIGAGITNYWPVLKSTWQISLAIGLTYFVVSSVAQINKWVGVGLLIPAFLLAILLNGLFWVRADRALRGQQIKVAEAMAKVKPRYLPMLGVGILLALIMGGIVLIGVGIGYFLISVLHASTPVIGALMLVICALLLVLIIYLYFPVLLVLFDDNSVLSSFKASCQLVHRYWWHTFWSLLITFLLIFSISFTLFGLLVMLFLGSAALPNNPDLSAPSLFGTSLIIFNIIKILANAILYPAIFTMVLLIFNDLKLRQRFNSSINK
jgi:hypothetical protein